MTLRRRLSRVVGGRGESRGSRGTPLRTGGSPGRMKRAKPPNVIGRGPLLRGRGFGVVVVCIVKDEAAYLEEWLGYHVALGIDHFIIYDNGSTDGSAELLERYQNHGLVTRVDWPLGGGQLAAYNHALRFFGAAADWLAYYDVDEFLVPLLDDDIPAFLARFPDAAVVRVPRLEFGFSGHRSPPQGLSIDAYTQVANVLDLDPDLPPRVKSIVRPGAVSAVDIHLAFPADAPSPGQPSQTAEEAVRGVAQLNHYYTRSFEEFEAKRFRGSATGRIDRPAVPFDVPTVETNAAAQRFSERTSRTITWLRQLEAQPYSYGSQLRLEWFPRPNDLGRFAEFAIANLAAGLVRPARFAALRLRNLHHGVGLVADLSATGYQPRRDGFSGSVHAEVLIAHMRGRLETSLSQGGQAHPVTAGEGTLSVPQGEPARLELVAGSTDLQMVLPATEMLRCWSLGFVVGCAAPLRIEFRVDRVDASSSEPVQLDLPASPCLAGIIEVEPTPQHATRLRLRVSSEAGHIDLHDLFAVSHG
jgi:hypothetical protein